MMMTLQQMRPQQYQYGTVGGYYPLQTTTTNSISDMMNSMMPMLMMFMMMAMIMPMMKGITADK
jgi:hypothetical protein